MAVLILQSHHLRWQKLSDAHSHTILWPTYHRLVVQTTFYTCKQTWPRLNTIFLTTWVMVTITCRTMNMFYGTWPVTTHQRTHTLVFCSTIILLSGSLNSSTRKNCPKKVLKQSQLKTFRSIWKVVRLPLQPERPTYIWTLTY